MKHMRTFKTTAAAAFLSAALIVPAAAQSDAEKIASRWMEDLKAMGATTASIGSMSTDGSNLTLDNVRIEWPLEFNIVGVGSLKINISGTSPKAVYTNLREVSEGYRYDRVVLADGSSVSASVNVGVDARMTISFNGYVGENVLQPRIPDIPEDANRPISRYFAVLKVIPLQEYTSFSVSEMRLTQAIEGTPETTTIYKDVKASNMKGGVLESYTIGEVTQTQVLPMQGVGDVELKTRVGLQTVRNFDYGYLISLFDPESYKSAQPPAGSKTVLESAEADGLDIAATGMFDARIGKFRFQNWTPARPKNSILDFADELAKGVEPNPDKIASIVFDVLALYQFDLAEIADVTVNSPFGVGGKLGTFRIANVSRDGMGLFNIGGLEVKGPGGMGGKLENYEISNIVFPAASAIIALIKADSTGDDPTPRQIMDVIPMISGVSLKGLSAVIPGGTVSLESSSLSMSDFIKPIPTKIKLDTKRLSIPVSLIDERDVRQFFTSLGYDQITISDSASVHWNEGTQDLTLEGLRFELEKGMVLEARAVIGGVPKLVFENPEMAPAAMGSLTVKELEIVFTDQSFVGRALEFQASLMGVSADQLKRQAVASIPMALAPLQNAAFTAKVEQAITKFLDKPGVLRISAKPANPVPAMEVMRAVQSAPQTLPELFNVEITAE